MLETGTSLRILYYGGGWPTNIGNAFIDLGAMAILREAFPTSQISFASEMPPWLFRFAVEDRARPRRFWPFSTSNEKDVAPNALDVASISICDLVVFSGMAMCKEFVVANGQTILKLATKGVPILLLGTGGQNYDRNEQLAYANFLREVRPIAFISRDAYSYESYRDVVDSAYQGIDCGFFVSDAFTPFKLDLPHYAVLNFDSVAEPQLNTDGLLVVRSHHSCFGPLSQQTVCHPNTLVSDIPQDYLSLYSQASEVHSDRVHTCVATLAYGNRARLYSSTKRGALFEAVGVPEVTQTLVSVDQNKLAEMKRAQVSLVREIVGRAGVV